MSRPVPPMEFDGYQLIECLGRGGMGEVHLATDTLLDRRVAIKFITGTRGDDTARARFMVEAKAFARLQHSNVVSIYRVGEVGGCPYLVSEYVKGEPLDSPDLFPMDNPQIQKIALGVARGLASAHRRGVIHRDIKPGNVMITEDGEPKILDFGIAKLMEANEEVGLVFADTTEEKINVILEATDTSHVDDTNKEQRPPADEDRTRTGRTSDPNLDFRENRSSGIDLTQPGTAVGTPRYMAPEVWIGTGATFRSDIYSFGAMIYYLCTGSPPHTGKNAQEIGRKIVREAPIPLLVAAPDTDPRLAQIVDQCLLRDPLQRYASGNELGIALTHLTTDIQTSVPSTEGNPYRGLNPFEQEHSNLFFGRDSEIRILLQRLTKDPMIIVAGDSGVGKSSLCRAGVIPRIDHWVDKERNWQSVTVVPGKHPLLALAIALASVMGKKEAEVEEIIQEEPGNIARMLRASCGPENGLIIFIDQLEELITQSVPEEAQKVSELFQWLSVATPGLRVLATIRSDYLGKLATLPGMPDQISHALFFLRPLTEERIRDAIVGPAKTRGVSFESAELINALVQPGIQAQGSLPLLQFALSELWNVRDNNNRTISQKSLGAIGGVAGALSRHADNVLEQMLPATRSVTRQILIDLVTGNGTRARRTPKELNPENSAQVVDALNVLVRERLLVVRQSASEATYEIAHEILLEAWSTLASWLSENEGAKLVKERLSVAVEEWSRLQEGKEALWSSRQIKETKILDFKKLGADEQRFIKASKRAITMSIAFKIFMLLGIPIVAGVVYLSVYFNAQMEQTARVNAEVNRASQNVSEARHQKQAADRIKKQAIDLFIAKRLKEGEALWRKYLAAQGRLKPLYTAASQNLETAYVMDRTRTDVKSLFADLLFERALLAEELHQADELDDLLKRLTLYDDQSRLEKWNTPGKLKISTIPNGGRISIYKEVLGADEKYSQTPISVKADPDGIFILNKGSYTVRVSLDGYVDLSYPVMIHRNKVTHANIKLLKTQNLPPGFAYVAAGDFLFGSSAQERNRIDFFHTVPLHQRSTNSFLIAIRETTFEQWFTYLKAIPKKNRSLRYPRVDKGGFQGALAVKELPDNLWEIQFQPASMMYTARSDENLIYPARKHRKEQQWLQMPVFGISIDDAEAYAKWLRDSGNVPMARLCTELEWEKAARGADGRGYPHGERIEPDDANFDNTYNKIPLAMGPDEVGSYAISTSPYGLLDMSGNVWEWTKSVLEEDGYVARGGSYYYGPNTSHTSQRAVTEPSFRDTSVGIRICTDPVF